MPNYSSYPPVNQIPGVGGAQPAAGPGPAGPGAPGAPVKNAALMGVSPIVNALRVLGISISGSQQAGDPNGPAMSSAFSNLLQTMAKPNLDKGAAMGAQGVQPAPGAPQPGAVQPQPAPAQAPAPVQAPAPAPTPAPAPQQVPAMQGQRPMGQGQGVKPFGQSQTQRPVNKQPVIL